MPKMPKIRLTREIWIQSEKWIGWLWDCETCMCRVQTKEDGMYNMVVLLKAINTYPYTK